MIFAVTMFMMAHRQEDVHGVMYSSENRAEVFSDGRVAFWTALHVRFASSFDLTYFPFDKQLIYVHLSTWTQSEEALKLEPSYDVLILSSHLHWDLIKRVPFVKKENFNGTHYDSIVFPLLLKRHPRFYIRSFEHFQT